MLRVTKHCIKLNSVREELLRFARYCIRINSVIEELLCFTRHNAILNSQFRKVCITRNTKSYLMVQYLKKCATQSLHHTKHCIVLNGTSAPRETKCFKVNLDATRNMKFRMLLSHRQGRVLFLDLK